MLRSVMRFSSVQGEPGKNGAKGDPGPKGERVSDCVMPSEASSKEVSTLNCSTHKKHEFLGGFF